MDTASGPLNPRIDRLRTAWLVATLRQEATTRAMLQTVLAGSWLMLAAFHGEPATTWWGSALLIASAASWLRVRRLTRRSVDVPGVLPHRVGQESTDDGLGEALVVLEVTALAVASVATGQLVFDSPDAALGGAVIVLAFAMATQHGLASVVGYAQGAASARERRGVARLALLFSGPMSALLLWPSHRSVSTKLIVAVGFIVLMIWGDRLWRHSAGVRAAVESTLDQAYRGAVRDLFLELHNDLRNPARLVLEASRTEEIAAKAIHKVLVSLDVDEDPAVSEWRQADNTARHLMRRLATRISEYVEMTRTGGTERPRAASDIVDAILAFGSTARHRYPSPVRRQLNASTLSRIDNELVSHCLTEFVGNALTAHAMALEVSVDTRPSPLDGTLLEVSVRCTCGAAIPSGRPRSGTLGVLADHLEEVNGSLDVTDHGDGSHTSIARWPTDARPARHD